MLRCVLVFLMVLLFLHCTTILFFAMYFSFYQKTDFWHWSDEVIKSIINWFNYRIDRTIFYKQSTIVKMKREKKFWMERWQKICNKCPCVYLSLMKIPLLVFHLSLHTLLILLDVCLCVHISWYFVNLYIFLSSKILCRSMRYYTFYFFMSICVFLRVFYFLHISLLP